jgi:hypothetical protein
VRWLMDCMTERGNEEALQFARLALAKADGINT